jgi:hypothetical protein
VEGGRVKVGKTGISFGNFVFFWRLGAEFVLQFRVLGLRSTSGIRDQNDADSYLNTRDDS